MLPWVKHITHRYGLTSFELLAITMSLFLLAFLTIDPWIARSVSDLDPSAYHVFRQLTHLGKTEWIVLPCVLLMLICWYFMQKANRKRLKAAYFNMISILFYVSVAVCITGLTSSLIKNSIGRARPKFLETLGPIEFSPFAFEADFASFPSGHTTTIFAFAIAITVLWPSLRVSVFLLAAWVALTRIFLGAHYLSDIVAGAGLGMVGGYLTALYFAQKGSVFRLSKTGKLQHKCPYTLMFFWAHIKTDCVARPADKGEEKQPIIDMINRHILN